MEPTNRELKIMLDNHEKTHLEKHDDLMRVLREVRDDGKETRVQATKTNGRVSTLEEWSKEAKQIIDASSKVIIDYGKEKVKVWTAISILLFLGGAIITLSVMAIDNKIENGIEKALSNYEIEIK